MTGPGFGERMQSEHDNRQSDKIKEILDLEDSMKEMSKLKQDESDSDSSRTVATNTTK